MDVCTKQFETNSHPMPYSTCIQMPLDITRSFVENADGTFDNYELPAVLASMDDGNPMKRLPIRPFELKTYLKVGKLD